jgi:hypothetical protein
MIIPLFLALLFLPLNCATEEESIRSQKFLEEIDLEFVGNYIELRNPLPRNGEEGLFNGRNRFRTRRTMEAKHEMEGHNGKPYSLCDHRPCPSL